MTLIEAFYKCRWPDEQSMSAEEIAEIEDATKVVLVEAGRLGRRLKSFPEDVVEEAVAVFIVRFCRSRSAEPDTEAKIRGFIYTAVLNNCRSLTRRGAGRGLDVVELDPEVLAAVATTEDTPESVTRAKEASSHLEDARRRIPEMVRHVAARLSAMTPKDRSDARLSLSAKKFSDLSGRLVRGDEPASPAERRAFQRAFLVLRALLPLACLDAGLAPLSVIELLQNESSLKGQSELLHGDEVSAMTGVDPRLKWVFAVAESWRERYSK